MKALALSLILAAMMVFTGCAGLKEPVPPPGPGRPTAPAPAPQATRPPASAQPQPPHQAVVALLDRAQAQAAAGQPGAAGASLERALRIEPRNPHLWQELARVRLGQGRYRQAENLAAKSNALAGGNQRLRAANWRIIGQARRQRGDRQGADAAFRKAVSLE